MKTTILLMALGLASTTGFAQQATLKAKESAGSSSTITAEKTAIKTSVSGNGEAAIHSDAAVKKTTEAVQKTKSAAETKITETGNEAKSAVNNTNASVSVQTNSSLNGDINAGNKNNDVLSVKNNSDVMLQKEIKGASVMTAEQSLESAAVNGLHKTSKEVKAGSVKATSAIRSNAAKISGTGLSAGSSVKSALKTKPLNAVVGSKTIAGLKIR